jgi:hypothetical protein
MFVSSARYATAAFQDWIPAENSTTRQVNGQSHQGSSVRRCKVRFLAEDPELSALA